jgi:hypothetical protein
MRHFADVAGERSPSRGGSDRRAVIAARRVGEPLVLDVEPDNPRDDNAGRHRGSVVSKVVRLAVLMLLPLGGTASAEGAWVLWATEWYDASLDRAPSVVQAFATQPDCLVAMERAARTFRQTMGGDAQVGRDPARDPGALVVFGKGHSVTLRCLPDTVDPRGPNRR